MIPYEDLVSALTDWRTRQGLPTGATNFLTPTESSVDLELPGTGEQEILDGADFVEEEGVAPPAPESDMGASAEQIASAPAPDFGAPSGFGAIPEPEGLEYGDDTQFGALDGEDTQFGGPLEAAGDVEIETSEAEIIEESVDTAFAGLEADATSMGEAPAAEGTDVMDEEATRVGGSSDFSGLEGEATSIGMGNDAPLPGEGDVDPGDRQDS